MAEGVFQEVGEGPFHEEPFPPGEARPFHLHEEPPPLRLVPVAEEEVLGQGPEVQGLAPGGAGLEAGEGEEVLRQAVAPGELLPQGAEEGDAPLLPQIVRPLQVVQEAQGGKEGGLEVVGQGGVQGLPGLQELLEPGEELGEPGAEEGDLLRRGLLGGGEAEGLQGPLLQGEVGQGPGELLQGPEEALRQEVAREAREEGEEEKPEEEGRPGAFPQGPQGEGQDQVGQEGEEGDDQGEPNP